MSLKRLIKTVGGVVKKLAPIAAPFIPGVGGVIATALASRGSSSDRVQMANANFVPGGGQAPVPGGLFGLPGAILTAGRSIDPTVFAPISQGGTMNVPAVVGGGFTTGGAFPAPVGAGGGGFARFPTRAPRPGSRLYRWSQREQKWKAVRRMNPLNVHALRRALRRAEGFVKVEKRVDKLLRHLAPVRRTAASKGFVKSRARR